MTHVSKRFMMILTTKIVINEFEFMVYNMQQMLFLYISFLTIIT